MSDAQDIGPELSAEEQRLAEHLQAARPVPHASFRGALGRYLAARDPGYGPRPGHLRLISCGYLAAGGLLLVLGFLQATANL